MPIKFKTAYQSHKRLHPKLSPKSLTHQSEAPQCDINTIMKKYERTGVLEHRNNFEGQYGNFADGPADYHESMNAVLAAEEMFGTLPARIRRRFHNDPGAFIEFANDPHNQEEMINLGLSKRRSSEDVLDDPSTSPKTTPKKATPPSTGSTQPKPSDKSSPDDA